MSDQIDKPGKFDAKSHLAEFKRELAQLINKYSLENLCNTPDFILAEYMTSSLYLFSNTSVDRENWYGKKLSAGGIEDIGK